MIHRNHLVVGLVALVAIVAIFGLWDDDHADPTRLLWTAAFVEVVLLAVPLWPARIRRS